MKRLFLLFAAVFLNQASSLAHLALTINTGTGQVDWLDGFSISTPGVFFDDNRFGTTFSATDLQFVSPLLSYSGGGLHYAVGMALSTDGTRIEGIGLATTAPPGVASFWGTSVGPMAPTFTQGNLSIIGGLANGDYTPAPIGSWNGGIHVNIVPEPSASFLTLISLGLLRVLKSPLLKKGSPILGLQLTRNSTPA